MSFLQKMWWGTDCTKKPQKQFYLFLVGIPPPFFHSCIYNYISDGYFSVNIWYSLENSAFNIQKMLLNGSECDVLLSLCIIVRLKTSNDVFSIIWLNALSNAWSRRWGIVEIKCLNSIWWEEVVFNLTNAPMVILASGKAPRENDYVGWHLHKGCFIFGIVMTKLCMRIQKKNVYCYRWISCCLLFPQ